MTLEIINYNKKYDDYFFNVIPILSNKKSIANDVYKPYFEKMYDKPIDYNKNIGVILGKTSDNLICFDDDTGEESFFGICPEYRETTFNTKSGKKGGHTFLGLKERPPNMPDDITGAKIIKNGKTIELFLKKRFIVLPPSFIVGNSDQPYKIINDTKPLQITHTEFSNILKRFENNGWEIRYTKEVKEKSEHIKADKTIQEILDDDWAIGCRYENGSKLALRRFSAGWQYDSVKEEAIRKNYTLTNPHEYDQVILWVKAGLEIHNKNINNPNQTFFKPIEDFKKDQEPKKEEAKTELKTEEQIHSKTKSVIDDTARDIKLVYTFVTLSNTNEILLYDGKTYDISDAKSLIESEAEKRISKCTTHDRNEVLNKIKAQTIKKLESFDADPNLITLENGILNLETLKLKPHTPEYLSRVLIPCEYSKPEYIINDETIFEDIEKNLKDTLFYKTLKSDFTVDNKFRKNDFETVLEIISSVFIKRHIDEKAFMHLGNGDNGKSVILDYVKSLIGEKNISRIPLQEIAEDKFMAANLAGKSANIFTDLEPGELKHAGKIKAITSGEGLEAQKKYGQPFTLYPFSKLMFSCNRFPKVYDQSQGFFRRWIIIKWERNFEKDPERIEYLREKLAENREEMNKVFSCLVYLARKLNRIGKFSHSKDWKTNQKDWNENADPIDWFDTNYIKESETNKTKIATYRFYKKVMLSKGETPLGMGQFSKIFAQYHDEYITKEGRTERVWLNITFDDNLLEVSDNT